MIVIAPTDRSRRAEHDTQLFRSAFVLLYFLLGAGLEEVAAREAVRLRRLEHVHVPVGIRGYGERANCRF